MIFNRYISFFIITFTLLLGFISCNITKHVPDNQQLLKKNIIEVDDKEFDAEPIRNYLKQKPNSKTAMIFNFHLWIYNLANDKSGEPRKIKKWLGIYKMGNIIGQPPVIADPNLNKLSAIQIQTYMQNKGYYRSTVQDTLLVVGRKHKKAKVYYNIKVGQPITIETINYQIEDSKIYNIVVQDTSNALLNPNALLDVDVLQSERSRISKLLKNNGYFKFSKEYIYYQVDTSLSDFKAIINVRLVNPSDTTIHKQYKIENIYYFIDFNPNDFLKQKEQYYQLFDTISFKNDDFLSIKKSFINPKVISNSSYLKKGELYSAYNIQNTFKRLSSLNEFQLINIRYNELEDSTKINVLVQMTPFKKHNYITELEGTNSSGNLGVGGRLTYQHKSLFRNAEIFNISLFGKLESQNTFTQGDENIQFNSKEIGANASIHFPKFLLPFSADRFIKKNNPRTALEFNMSFKSRPEYTRSIYGSSFGYYWISERFFRHQFKLIDLNAVKVYDMATDYYASIQNSYLEKSFDDYLISASSYSLYFTNKTEKKKTNYFSVIFNGEIAGNILNLYSTLTKQTAIEGSYYFLNNKFAQYWRAELDLRFNHTINERDQLVYRVYGGMAHPYGNITAMPYVKQFFSGGANGLRAWPVRSLGPGSYYNDSRKYYNEAADLKLEGNIEYRFKLFWVIEGAWFIDAGNIWATNSKDPRLGSQFKIENFYEQIAIGTGLGFRFDFSFFILRLDYGIKVREPKEIATERWVMFDKKYNPIGADYSMFNFGIGYPF